MLLRLQQVVFGLARGVLGASPNRMGIWTQGCSLPKCPGCSSTHTWDPNGGKAIPVDSLLCLARAQAVTPSGLTLSGGEPTDQAEGMTVLLQGFREAFPDGEIVLYTGLRWPVVSQRFPALLANLDVVVAGPYVSARDPTPLTGSSNQEVHLLTPLARRLYQDWQSWPRHALQVAQRSPLQLVTVGIPDTARLNAAAGRTGAVDLTWKPIKERSRK